MDGVILCGGKGGRMGKFSSQNKCMIEREGKPLIAHIVSYFDHIGIERTYLITGHEGDQVREYFRGVETATDVDFIDDGQFEVSSTSRALMLVGEVVKGDFMYSHGEIHYQRSLVEELYEMDLGKRAGIIALSDDVERAPTHPKVLLSGDYVSEIGREIPERGKKYSYMGVGVFSTEIFNHLSSEALVSGALRRMINAKKQVGYLLYKGEWCHFGTAEDLRRWNDGEENMGS